MSQTFGKVLAFYQFREDGSEGPTALRQLLDARGVTVSHGSCVNWLSDKRPPHGSTLGDIADAFKLEGSDRLVFLDLACKVGR